MYVAAMTSLCTLHGIRAPPTNMMMRTDDACMYASIRRVFVCLCERRNVDVVRVRVIVVVVAVVAVVVGIGFVVAAAVSLRVDDAAVADGGASIIINLTFIQAHSLIQTHERALLIVRVIVSAYNKLRCQTHTNTHFV